MGKNTRQKKRTSISMRRRLFLIMLALSIIPTLIITTIATFNTYNRIYDDTIQFNSQGVNWSHEQLRQFTDEMKNLFYSMEFDPDYKQAIIGVYNDSEASEDRTVIRDMLVTHLNRRSFLSTLDLHIQGAGLAVKAERAGVRIEPASGQSILPFPRKHVLQTNIFFKVDADGLSAIHNIYRFEDRALLAQQSAGIKTYTLNNIVQKLQIFTDEEIYILNDESEILFSLQERDGGTDNLTDDLQLLSAEVEAAQVDKVKYADLDGRIFFSTYDPQEKLSIVKIVNRQEIVRSVLPTIYSGIIIGILSILGAIALSAILSRFISRPVERLANRVKNIKMQTLVLEEDDETADEVSVLEHHISRFVERIRELIRDEYDIKLQARTAQVHALQAQINPHFLHNTLQLIGSISLAENVPEVYTVSSALSSLMRYSMDFEYEFVTLEEELNHLDNFFLIQKQRFMDRFSIAMHIDKDAKTCLIPKLLVQPIVENAFTHGFSRKSGLWKLAITAFEDEDQKVRVIIRDNGIGMEPEKVAKLNKLMADRYTEGMAAEEEHSAEHIGLINVNDRIKLSYSTDDGVFLRSELGEWTEVTLVFDTRREQ